MKMRNIVMTGIVCLTTTLTAMAGFTPPTESQILAAAADPSQLKALLSGASSEQAAHVVKTVLARIGGLDLGDKALEIRINQAMSATMAVLPPASCVAFANMLGNEMGNSLAIRSQPAIVSATQGALAANAGTFGEAASKAFGDSYKAAASGSSNSQNTKDADKVQPPAAILYPGQN